MSGPKTSRYTLTEEQRKILARQREIERRKARAAENILQNRKKLLQIGEMFSAEKQIADELIFRDGTDNGIYSLFKELDLLIPSTDSLIRGMNADDVNSIEKTSEAIGLCVKKAEEITLKIYEVASKNEFALKSEFRKAIEKGIGLSFANIDEIKPSATESLRKDAAQRLEYIYKINFLPNSYKSEINRAIRGLEEISDDAFLKNFVALNVNPLIKQVNKFIAEYKECKNKFDGLYAEYRSLCELYRYVAQEYVCSRESVQALEREIERIEKSVAEDDEKAYISDCLDEVMAEMGYSVLGFREVTKRNGKRFRNELYEYGEGTAVNVTYSSDGKIAMEVCGIDKRDRIPTEGESELLCESMEQFCEDFERIEKKLSEKGVAVGKRISLLPPNEEYAQIVNTSDYSMKNEVDAISVKRQRKSTLKQKTLLGE